MSRERIDSIHIPSPCALRIKTRSIPGKKTTVATAPSTNDNPVKNEKPSALEIAAKVVLDSEENKKFQQYLGIRSPEAEKAVTQLKAEKNNSSNHDLDEIEENIIKKNREKKGIRNRLYLLSKRN